MKEEPYYEEISSYLMKAAKEIKKNKGSNVYRVEIEIHPFNRKIITIEMGDGPDGNNNNY